MRDEGHNFIKLYLNYTKRSFHGETNFAQFQINYLNTALKEMKM